MIRQDQEFKEQNLIVETHELEDIIFDVETRVDTNKKK